MKIPIGKNQNPALPYYLKHATFNNKIVTFKETGKCERYSGKNSKSNIGVSKNVKQLL